MTEDEKEFKDTMDYMRQCYDSLVGSLELFYKVENNVDHNYQESTREDVGALFSESLANFEEAVESARWLIQKC